MMLLSTKELQLSGCTVSCQSDHLLRCVLTTSCVTKKWVWPFTFRPSSSAAFFSAEGNASRSPRTAYPDTVMEEKRLQIITFCWENWSLLSLTYIYWALTGRETKKSGFLEKLALGDTISGTMISTSFSLFKCNPAYTYQHTYTYQHSCYRSHRIHGF